MLSPLKGEAIVRQSFVDSIRRGDARNEFVSHESAKKRLAAQTFPAKFHSKSSAEEKEEEKTIIAMVIKMATFSRAFEKRFRQVPFPGSASRLNSFSLPSTVALLHFASSLSPKRRNRVSLKDRSFSSLSIPIADLCYYFCITTFKGGSKLKLFSFYFA